MQLITYSVYINIQPCLNIKSRYLERNFDTKLCLRLIKSRWPGILCEQQVTDYKLSRFCNSSSYALTQLKQLYCTNHKLTMVNVIFKSISNWTQIVYAPIIRKVISSCKIRLLQGLVIAGISDLRRPVDQLSIAQSASLAATGVIWSRYSLVIIPKNYGLFSVNVFVAMTQLYQLYRAIK